MVQGLTVMEEIILTTIWRLKENAYGVSIRKKVAEVTQQDIIYGTLYNALDQLVRKGYIRKFRGLPVPTQGGRSKMFYRLTESGTQAMERARRLRNLIWRGIPELKSEQG